jgi:hypothetical protein
VALLTGFRAALCILISKINLYVATGKHVVPSEKALTTTCRRLTRNNRM